MTLTNVLFSFCFTTACYFVLSYATGWLVHCKVSPHHLGTHSSTMMVRDDLSVKCIDQRHNKMATGGLEPTPQNQGSSALDIEVPLFTLTQW